SSSTYGHRGYVSVSYFRGGGTGNYRQQEPSISSSLIYSSLFHMKYFEHVFNATIGPRTLIDSYGVVDKKSLPVNVRGKIPLTVHSATAPVTISDNLHYFWGPHLLPDKNANNCSNYISSNRREAISMCKTDEMERCSRNLADLSDLNSFTFSAPQGKTYDD
ncbi:hypothetical protein PFISCL1PPCAC_2481, partial [Pristionchus fissidentatus]